MFLNLFYLLALALLSPWLLWRAARTGRYRRDLGAKFLGRVAVRKQPRPVAWFHAVSVGEVNLLGTLVPAFRTRHPDWHVVVSSTTDTGLDEARRKFPDLDVIAWPLDFSWAVAAALRAVNPALVVLTESELWPNFLAAARARNVPVVVVNARLSPRSARRLAKVAGVARRLLFRHVTRFAIQEHEYAERLRHLGVPAEKLVVTGSIKYDGAATPNEAKVRALAATLGLSPLHPLTPSPLLFLAGSTHAPEEAIVLGVFARLRARFPHLRLLLVPRHRDRFEEVARLVEASGLPFARRSQIVAPLAEMPAVVLLDTVGELGAAWGLADVGFTGGSLDGQRGGQSMIEPAGYGVPCTFGPHVWNFKDAAKRLVEVGGAFRVKDEAELEVALAQLISDPDLRARMGTAARALVARQQGATARTLAVLDALIPSAPLARAA
ncbi:MAG: 3-deoxy-D-manno-octulosonic acid transferase [Planctomycetes bacterium]|nr:3-deoxy-D-manno-octulosonic acid transferase [Planctomycetota bacterium]